MLYSFEKLIMTIVMKVLTLSQTANFGPDQIESILQMTN